MRTSAPAHWKVDLTGVPVGPCHVIQFIFMVLGLISFGHADLEPVWKVAIADDKDWIEQKDRLAERINAITVIARLMLSSTAAFATTPPPSRSLLDYTGWARLDEWAVKDALEGKTENERVW
ncbi:unnamed protein product [Somion occarium]